MPRPQSTEGGRPIVVSVRFSKAEAADMDARKGSLSRSEWLRFLNGRARRQDLRFDSIPPLSEG